MAVKHFHTELLPPVDFLVYVAGKHSTATSPGRAKQSKAKQIIIIISTGQPGPVIEQSTICSNWLAFAFAKTSWGAVQCSMASSNCAGTIHPSILLVEFKAPPYSTTNGLGMALRARHPQTLSREENQGPPAPTSSLSRFYLRDDELAGRSRDWLVCNWEGLQFTIADMLVFFGYRFCASGDVLAGPAVLHLPPQATRAGFERINKVKSWIRAHRQGCVCLFVFRLKGLDNLM